jgi:hypothetical protein
MTLAAPPIPVDVSGWRSLPKVNERRFRSKGHGYLWVDVHLEPQQQAVLNVRTSPVAPGFRVVTAGYEAAEGGEPIGLTVMAKMPPGYDTENGDWYYEVLGPDGATPTMGGKLAPCIGCHRQARARDFLFDVTTHDEGPGPAPG